jgi:hypothetical protein
MLRLVNIRLIAWGELIPGEPLEFWKEIPEPSHLPRVGELVDLGVRTGASPELDRRQVIEVRWNQELNHVLVTLEQLHSGWLQANRRELEESGWIAAIAAGG